MTAQPSEYDEGHIYIVLHPFTFSPAQSKPYKPRSGGAKRAPLLVVDNNTVNTGCQTHTFCSAYRSVQILPISVKVTGDSLHQAIFESKLLVAPQGMQSWSWNKYKHIANMVIIAAATTLRRLRCHESQSMTAIVTTSHSYSKLVYRTLSINSRVQSSIDP